MLTVWYANSLDALARPLADMIRKAIDPFKPLDLLVPNRNVGRWLQFHVAAHNGIAAHLRCNTLDELLPKALPAPWRLLDEPALHLLLHHLFTRSDFLRGQDARIPRQWILAQGDDDDTIERRAFALASQLASIFTQYTLQRPEMIEHWSARTTFREEPQKTLEQWQRHIFLHLTRPGGLLDQIARERGVRWIFAADIPRLIPQSRLRLPRQLLLFGMEPSPAVHYDLLLRLGDYRDVHIFSLNPSQAFWEDIRTTRDEEDQLFSSAPVHDDDDDPEAAPKRDFWSLEEPNPALRALGRAGRDHVWALNQRVQHMAREVFVDPLPDDHEPSLLQRIQQDILFATPADEERDPHEPDSSILLMECPGARREAEVIANTIWTLMRDPDLQPPLRFNDIAVLVPDEQRQSCAAHLLAAFEAVRRIPAEVIDERALPTHRMLDAILQLLDLPLGSFRRDQLLRFMLHPNVIARFPDLDPEEWMRWTHQLNIIFGADRADHANTYLDDDLFNWDQGLRRLALGAFMGGNPQEDASEAPEFKRGDTSWLPETLEPSQLPSAARFIWLARSLIHDARWLRTLRQPLRTWATTFTALLDTYIIPTDDEKPDLFFAWRAAAASLAERDVAGHPVAYATAAAAARRALRDVEFGDASFQGEGVAIASLEQGAGLPFRVIFVTGLTEGRFPRGESTDPLDLRTARWQRADVSLRELDRYRFLLALTAARDRLILTWTSVDLTTGDDLQPSSVTRELTDYIKKYRVKPSLITVKHPLRRFEPNLFANLRPQPHHRPPENVHRAAFEEARLSVLRDDLLHTLQRRGIPNPDLRKLPTEAPPDLWRTLQPLLRPWRPPADAPPPRPDADTRVASLSLSRLRQFLLDPLQTTAALRIRRNDDAFIDVLDVDHEPFDPDKRSQNALLRSVLHNALYQPRGWGNIRDLYHKTARNLAMRGELPAGLFRHATQRRHLRTFTAWRANFAAFQLPEDLDAQLVSLGRQREAANVLLQPLRLDLPHGSTPAIADLHGLLEPLLDERRTILKFIDRREPYDTDYFYGALCHLALCVLYPEDTSDRRLLVIPSSPLGQRTTSSTFTRRLPHVPKDIAFDYLYTLTTDLLTAPQPLLLPAQAALDYARKTPGAGPDAFRALALATVERQRKAGFAFEPVRNVLDYPTPEDPDDLIQRRFGLLFELLFPPGAS